jgi:hypothetical protein
MGRPLRERREVVQLTAMSDQRRDQQMRKLAEAGWTLARIGERYGLSRQRVSQIIGSVGRRYPARDIVKENLPLIRSLWAKGVSYNQIAKRIGVQAHSLIRIFDRPSNYHGTVVHGTANAYHHHRCRCEHCSKAESQRTMKYVRKKRRKKLCLRCGAPSPEYWHCDSCRERINRWQREEYRHRNGKRV